MMQSGKPNIKPVIPNQGSSFSVKYFDEPSPDPSGRFWHFHPEIELVYVSGGSGKRHIGNHLSYFSGGELVLIGSNLPHSGFSDQLYNQHKEIVIQFLPDFLCHGFFNTRELQSVHKLLEMAKLGIAFPVSAQKEIGDKIVSLVSLPPFKRMISLLEVLQYLAHVEDIEVLNADHLGMNVEMQDNDRIQVIFKYVKDNFQRNITLKEMAELVNLTEPSFSRYFKNSTGRTFTQFVNQYRLVHASKLLSENEFTIGQVALECGFSNFSHFNNLFRREYGQTAKEYRKNIRELLQ